MTTEYTADTHVVDPLIPAIDADVEQHYVTPGGVIIEPSPISEDFDFEASIVTGIIEIDPRMVGKTASNGDYPQYWFQWGDTLVIEPAPDGIYPLLVYAAMYPRLKLRYDDTQAKNLPKEFHSSLVDFALYASCLKSRKWGTAAFYYNRYIVNLGKRFKDYMDRKAAERKETDTPADVERG
jgi:hypothetical protein